MPTLQRESTLVRHAKNFQLWGYKQKSSQGEQVCYLASTLCCSLALGANTISETKIINSVFFSLSHDRHRHTMGVIRTIVLFLKNIFSKLYSPCCWGCCLASRNLGSRSLCQTGQDSVAHGYGTFSSTLQQ